MTSKDFSSEEKILSTAIEIFLEKGYDGARMQEIADKAEINKALLHYYYRNKENLFIKSFEKILNQFFSQLLSLLSSREETSKVIHQVAEVQRLFIAKNDGIPLFLINTMKRHPKMVQQVLTHIKAPLAAQTMIEKVAAMKKTTEEEARHWWLSFMSLRLMPEIGSGLFQTMLDLDKTEYAEFKEKHQAYILSLLM
jgi:AcrR family transcriptional regulator